MPRRKTLTLSDKAADLLPQLAGYRDQGAYVSQLIESIADAVSPEELLQLHAESQKRMRRSGTDITNAQELLARLEMADLEMVRQILSAVILEIVELKGRAHKSR